MGQPRFVDISDRLNSLSRLGDNLETVNVVVDRETVRPALGAAFGETLGEAGYLALNGQIARTMDLICAIAKIGMMNLSCSLPRYVRLEGHGDPLVPA